MSRLAKKPLQIPSGVEVKVEGNTVTVKGPKGALKQDLLPYVKIDVKDGNVWVRRNEDILIRKSQVKILKSFQGTYWSLIRNMIEGVTKGFEKQLEIVGVGYRVQMQSNKISLQLGYAHPVVIEPPEGVTVEVPNPASIVVRGIDKQAVGQFAALIRSRRKPNVYSGKGIRYKGEFVRQKEGKKA